MPDPLLSQAIQEAYAACPADVVILHTLEIWHPTFLDGEGNPAPIRVVRDHADLTARLEAAAPRHGGQRVIGVNIAHTLGVFAFLGCRRGVQRGW
ncbi:DUF1833 family protein, partial [Magnetospirillum moscoviense]|uniref:DUF1833 family protein n=1 Tax=Magnetospirillum moscoviense TaxID=1437059 RepID=UPI000A9EF95F